ncbi:MAG: NUDIX domain-containing protein [Parcubacteria group bacterium]
MCGYKKSETEDGRQVHYASGAIIERDGKYLLMDRMHPPFGFACSAGHIDEGETPEETVVREVEEETGLKVTKYELVMNTVDEGHACSHGVDVHEWSVYRCEVTGEMKFNLEEAKSIDWYSSEEMKQIKIEPIWEYIFKKLKII